MDQEEVEKMQEYYELVQKGFRILVPALSGYLRKELSCVYKDNWWDEVLFALGNPRDLPTQGTYGDLVDSLDDYKLIKGNTCKYTKGSSEGLTFTFNGPFSKFIGIKVNGYEVAEQYYDAKAGSTIITLKQSYLKNLTARKHTITVLYTDGEATAEFTVQAKATTPATGDDSGIMIWTAVFFISTMSLTALVVYQKKFAYKGKYVRK